MSLSTRHLPTLVKSLAFWNLAVLMVVLGSGTFVEKNHGTEYAYAHVYGTWWFVALWALLVVLTSVGLIKGKIYKNIPLFLVHLSFMVILLGAMCTRLFSLQGYVTIRTEKATNILSGDKQLEQLPFSLQLDTFYVQYYPGTDAPADYISRFIITDASGEITSANVSMNNIFQYNGYRFYQSSYEPDGKASVLSVNRDVPGIMFTYSGYALFVLSVLWFLFSSANPYRKLLKHPLLKMVPVFLLFLIPEQSSATRLVAADSLTVDATHAAQFGRLYMLYEGHITSVSAFAYDFTLKLTGKPKFAHLNADQVLMGFLFLPAKWQQVALFEVKDPVLKQELNSQNGKAAVNDFFDEHGSYKLTKYWIELSKTGPKTALLKEVEKLNEKVQLINMLHSGSLLQLFPVAVKRHINWLQPIQKIPLTISDSDSIFVRNALSNYYRALLGNNDQKSVAIINEIAFFQMKNAKLILPSAKKRDIEIFYLKAGFTSLLFKVNLTLGLLAFVALFSFKGKAKTLSQVFLYVTLVLSFIVLTISIGLRAYIAGRLPMSNGFETMVIIAWCALLPALFLSRRMTMVLPFGLLLSGFALLVAHLGMSNPKITPLMPVLSSPLLSIHVSIIMLAYTLLAFVSINSLATLVQILIARCKDSQTLNTLLERNKIFSLLCLYPAILFLGTGIFIGAVWANVSWGRYWAWDPKEVWALITFMIYGLFLHPKVFFIANTFWFHVFGLLAFSTVLMTYFGVNYVLGGMHSYAGEMDITGIWMIAFITLLLLVLLVGLAYYKYKRLFSCIDT